MTMGRRDAIARRWYSYPSPACCPVQFMKKPTLPCTIPMAPSMMTMMDAAEKRGRMPAMSPSPPKNSPIVTR